MIGYTMQFRPDRPAKVIRAYMLIGDNEADRLEVGQLSMPVAERNQQIFADWVKFWETASEKFMATFGIEMGSNWQQFRPHDKN